jgi:hypothetical protein
MINADQKVTFWSIGHLVRRGDLVAIGGEADTALTSEIGR